MGATPWGFCCPRLDQRALHRRLQAVIVVVLSYLHESLARFEKQKKYHLRVLSYDGTMMQNVRQRSTGQPTSQSSKVVLFHGEPNSCTMAVGAVTKTANEWYLMKGTITCSSLFSMVL